MRSLTLADDGGAVELAPGETLAIRLPENAATGYRWTADDLDPHRLELLPEQPRRAGAAVGSGGEIAFLVRALAPGTTTLSLSNRREWVGAASTIGRFRLRVHIRAPD